MTRMAVMWTSDRQNNSRTGKSLLELLVVLAVIGTLLAVLLPAVVQVRKTAQQVYDTNNLKQIVLATHNYAGAQGGALPGIQHPTRWAIDLEGDIPPLLAIQPYIEANATRIEKPGFGGSYVTYKQYLNPADPSFEFYKSQVDGQQGGNTSYGYNMLGFSGRSNLNSTFTDGTSNTIAYAEHYSTCGGMWDRQRHYNYALYLSNYDGDTRRGSFADANYRDVMPSRAPGGGTTGTRPGSAFQQRPDPANCDPNLLQAPFGNVLYVAMFDGSVRPVHSTVNPAVFWSAVTPNWGEVVGLE